MHECRLLGGCKTGQAKVTGGYQLPAKHIIHTVGPVWRGGAVGEPDLLASCYRESLARAQEIGAKTLGVPAISTGIYGYPIGDAARVAVSTIGAYLAEHPESFEQIALVCFDEQARAAFDNALEEM